MIEFCCLQSVIRTLVTYIRMNFYFFANRLLSFFGLPIYPFVINRLVAVFFKRKWVRRRDILLHEDGQPFPSTWFRGSSRLTLQMSCALQ